MPITLNDVTDVITEYQNKLQDIAAREEELSSLKQEAKVLGESTIPSMFHELGINSYELNDGSKISCKPDVSCTLNKDAKPQALQWLAEHGYSDLIKTKVMIHYPRAKRDDAVITLDNLLANHVAASMEEKVEPQTLKKWAAEQISKGVDIPEDLFNVYHYTKTVITKAKVN